MARCHKKNEVVALGDAGENIYKCQMMTTQDRMNAQMTGGTQNSEYSVTCAIQIMSQKKKKKPKETYGGQTEEQRMGSKSTLEKWLVLGLGREDTDVLEELKTTAGSL